MAKPQFTSIPPVLTVVPAVSVLAPGPVQLVFKNSLGQVKATLAGQVQAQ